MSEPLEAASDSIREVPASLRRAARTLAFVLFVAVIPLVARISGVSRDYWLMNDQIRDWDLVQSSFGSLPVTGTPRSGGGYHVGPAYYHFLWLSRVVLSPFLGNLPHVAGITVTTLDVAGACALSVAAWRIGVPFLVALASGILLTTSPYAAALSRAGWNPPLALAFSNLGLALYLTRRKRWSLRDQALLAALCWIAVEMHTAAFPLALCLIAMAAVLHTGAGQPHRARLLATSALVILVLQLPPLLTGLPADAATESSVSLSLARLSADPWALLSARGLRFVVAKGSHQLLIWMPVIASQGAVVLTTALAISGWAVLAGRLEWGIALAAVAPLAIAAAAFTILDRELEAYWLIPSLGVYALALALPSTLLCEPRRRRWASGACLVAVLSALPSRWTHFTADHRYPLYGTLVAAAAAVAHQGPPVRALVGPADGVRPTTSSPLVRWQGGTLSPSASVVARVSRNGQVSFIPALEN
jgi:hypothetical protein